MNEIGNHFHIIDGVLKIFSNRSIKRLIILDRDLKPAWVPPLIKNVHYESLELEQSEDGTFSQEAYQAVDTNLAGSTVIRPFLPKGSYKLRTENSYILLLLVEEDLDILLIETLLQLYKI